MTDDPSRSDLGDAPDDAADVPGAHGLDPPRDDVSAHTIRAFAAGDEDAFSEIYARYCGPMFTVAMRTLGRRELAAEAVQQAFLQAWRAASSISPDSPIAPWLFTITKRCAIDVWRKEARHAVASDSQSLDETSARSLEMDTVWDAWQVRSALDRLSQDERDVVRLAYVHGLSQSEISLRLSVPLGTVKSRSTRAHRQLRQLLAHLAPETDPGMTP